MLMKMTGGDVSFNIHLKLLANTHLCRNKSIGLTTAMMTKLIMMKMILIKPNSLALYLSIRISAGYCPC